MTLGGGEYADSVSAILRYKNYLKEDLVLRKEHRPRNGEKYLGEKIPKGWGGLSVVLFLSAMS